MFGVIDLSGLTIEAPGGLLFSLGWLRLRIAFLKQFYHQ
jgi:hypothetical protein